jgi:hypothetical protein
MNKMETIQIDKDSDTAIEYLIHSNGVDAKVRFYPNLMGSHDYEFLAKEIQKFYKTFWNMNGEVDWKDCIGSNKEMEDEQYDFFRNCNFIKPLEEMEKAFEKRFEDYGGWETFRNDTL